MQRSFNKIHIVLFFTLFYAVSAGLMFYFSVKDSKMRIQNRIEKLNNDLSFITKLHAFQQSIKYEISGSSTTIFDEYLLSQNKELSFGSIKALFLFDQKIKEIVSYQIRDSLSYTLLSKISRSMNLDRPSISGEFLFLPHKISVEKKQYALVSVVKIREFVSYVPATSNLFMNYRGEIESVESFFKTVRYYKVEAGTFTLVYLLFSLIAFFLATKPKKID